MSSAISAYFDALEFSCASVTGGRSSSGGGGTGTGGGERPPSLTGFDSPVPASPRGSSGGGGFNASMPRDIEPQQHQHHPLHRVSKLAAVPSGELPEGDAEGPQPRCCTIS